VASLTGLPALNVPCGFDADGMPMGLQIIGRPFAEATLLRAGHAFQQATDFHRRAPVLRDGATSTSAGAAGQAMAGGAA
jgi:aspartyl-tRNA(Asn)/glutamyl-tRNA(Gln) amidotransferase subunit A